VLGKKGIGESGLGGLDLPRTPEGKVDFAQNFFGRKAFF